MTSRPKVIDSSLDCFPNCSSNLIVPIAGSLLFGFDFGATGSLLSTVGQYKNGFDDDRYSYFVLVANSEGLTGLIAAGSSIGATVTFLFLLFLGNQVPKNDEIIISALFYFIGALFESLSGSLPWRNINGLVLLISGRLLYGAGIALSFHSVPEYISEISPKIGRGSVCSLTEAMAVVGVCLGFLVGYLAGAENGFVVSFRVGYIIALFMGCLAIFLPRSPLYLLKNGADEMEILESLQYTQPTATLELVAELRKSYESGKAIKTQWEKKLIGRLENVLNKGFGTQILLWLPSEVKVLFMSRTLRRCLLLALLLVFLQQFSGQGAILYYSGEIFGELCPNSQADCVIGFGMVKLFFVIVMVFAADWWGRRKFLIGGASFMTLGLVLLCVGLSQKQYPLALLGIFMSAAANEVSLATLLWVVLCEIFPQFVRSAAMSIAIATLFMWSSIVVFILPYIAANVGLLVVFITYTVTAGISVVLMYFLVPETRGIDLEISYKLVNIRIDKTTKCCRSESMRDQSDEYVQPTFDLRESDEDLRPPSSSVPPRQGSYNSI